MSFPTAPGAARYTGNFIPEIWSSKIVENFYDATVLAAISNTDYEGEIRAHGDKVRIRTTPDLTIRSYHKGMPLTVERPDKAHIMLEIDRGEYFAAIEDDVDKVQSDINLMNLWTKDASEKMKITIDAQGLTAMLPDVSPLNRGATAGRVSQALNLGAAGTPFQVTRVNVLDLIVDLGTVLDEANAPESDRYMVIPAWMAGMVKKSDLKDASLTGDGGSILRNGRLGMVDSFTLYTSHNLNAVQDGVHRAFSVVAGHKSGLTFASQMTEMETIRAESTFGNIVRGLQVWGLKVVQPSALAVAYVRQ